MIYANNSSTGGDDPKKKKKSKMKPGDQAGIGRPTIAYKRAEAKRRQGINARRKAQLKKQAEAAEAARIIEIANRDKSRAKEGKPKINNDMNYLKKRKKSR